MSKRTSQSQGGKDIGFGPEMSANPDDIPKRATAAQLAARKIKQARQRPRVASSSTATSTSQSFPSPFNTIDPNIVPPNSSAGTNGFSFNPSQSFPAPTPGPGTQTMQSPFFGDQNNTGSKLFGSQSGVTPPSSSFSFSTSANQEIKNPFSNLSSGFSQSQGGGFQGFQGNTFNIPGTANQGTPNKPSQLAQTRNIFGVSQPQQPQQTSFLFGGSKAPNTTAPFSPAPPASAAPATSTAPFGQSSNTFGASSTSISIFGAASQVGNPSDEMQTSPDSKTGAGANRQNQFFVSGVSQPSFTAPSGPPPLFQTSTPSTSKPFSSSLFQPKTSAGSTLFGNLNKSDAPAAPASTIGQPSPKFSFTPSLMTGSSIFGQASKPEEKAAATSTTSTDSATSSVPAFTNSFQAPSSAPFSLFGDNSKRKEQSSNQFASENQPSSSQSPAPPPASAPESSTLAATGTVLFGRISKPAESTTSASVSDSQPAPATGTSPKSPPPAPAAPVFPSTPSSTSLFGRASKPAEITPATSMFGTPATSGATTSTSAFSFTPRLNNLFQTSENAPATATPEAKPKEDTQTTKSLCQTSSTETTSTTQSKPLFSSFSHDKPATSNIFGSKNPTAPEKVPSTPPAPSPTPSFTPTTTVKPLFGAITNGGAITKPKEGTPAKPMSSTKRKEPIIPKFRLSSYGPPAIPHELNNDERAEFDTQWRVHALNTSFKKNIATTDPSTDDLESLIEFYIIMRQNIGAPTNMRVLPRSGTKRKALVMEEISLRKKARDLDSIASQNGTADHHTSSATSSFSTTDMNGSFSSEKSSDVTSSFCSITSPPGKRKADYTANAAASSNEASKRSKHFADNSASSSVFQKPASKSIFSLGGSQSESTKDTNHEKKTDDDTDSTVNGASDTLTVFATSYVSQSQRAGTPSILTGPSSAASPTSGVDEAPTSPLSGRSESEHDSDASTESVSTEERESESSPTPPATSNGGGRSLFDRVELDENGKPVRQELPGAKGVDGINEPNPAEKDTIGSSIFATPKFSSSFNSSRSSSTSLFQTNGLDFKSPGTLSPLKPSPGLSDSKSFPGITAASPDASAPTSTPTPSPALVPTSVPATSTLFSGATSSILPNGNSQLSPFSFSASTSANVSRATTPNLSDTGADEYEDAVEDLPQVDLLRGGAGEENEDELFDVRAKALQFKAAPGEDKPKWHTVGLGLLRILKNKTTGRSRVLLRADPSGRVLLNANLIAPVNYKNQGTAVQFLVPVDGAKPEQWVVRVKEEKMAVELAQVMEKNKK
ncbi:hypothetical protein GX48_05921 [Paracoccidioides brasiliensis]|nr:hypothetical protein GX48_05921 [Paracoccidioides brasiliensis]